DLREGGELALRRTATVVDDAGAHHDTERLVGREARTADPNELPVDEPVGRRHLEWMALRVEPVAWAEQTDPGDGLVRGRLVGRAIGLLVGRVVGLLLVDCELATAAVASSLAASGDVHDRQRRDQ